MFRQRFLVGSQVSDWHNNAANTITIPNRTGTPGPDRLSGLILWLSADKVTGINNGDVLATWNDVSGNGRNFSSAGATWNTSRTPTAGPAAVSTSSSFTIGSFMATVASSGAELFFCFKPTIATNNFLVDWGTDSLQDHWPYTGSDIYSDFGSNSRKTVGSYLTVGTWTNMSVYSVANDWGVFKNGALIFSTGSNSISWSGNTHGIGNGSELAEFFAFNRKLTTQERSSMFTYLQRHIS